MPIERNIENPYRVGNPIKDPDYFFGRGHELESIFERIEKGECISLVGERRIGRTSLLWQVMNENVQAKYMGKDHGHPFVLIDCQLGVKTPEGFFCEAFRAIEELDGAFSFEAGDQIGYKRQVRNCLEKFGAKRYGQQGLVVLLDEFEYIARGNGFPLDFFSFLRGIVLNYDVCFVVATKTGLHECCRPEIVGSPFFNIFVPLYLGSFTEEEFDYFVAETSRRSGVSVYDHKDTILDLAGRFPYFVQLACEHYFQALSACGRLLPADHETIRQAYTSKVRGQFKYIWNNLDAMEKQTVCKLASGDRVTECPTTVTLTRKGYLVNGRLLSSEFGKFALQQTSTGFPRSQSKRSLTNLAAIPIPRIQTLLASLSALGRNILRLARWIAQRADEIAGLIVIFTLIAFIVRALLGRESFPEVNRILSDLKDLIEKLLGR
jgi:hypothetical protein